ncbi:hypothetical protein [Erwinia sp. HR93]|uniref:hypothetical protein n=1 Tax=Erwinia sp. HR93 TaxID=3094840 RepID=UPI002ADECAB8|nr:hypothetical protein [Erwinia sp. HR93]MEA1063513.1 hypothetical protein [Erwinia sp. HR93]
MLITRLKAIAAFFIFFIVGLGGIYFSIKNLSEYFEFHTMIVYSWMDCFALLFSFVFFLFSMYPAHVALCGFPMPPNKAKSVYKLLFSFFVISLATPVLFSFIYINKIESKGYIKCKGIPSGWMPGMATKYATSELLCSKKDR